MGSDAVHTKGCQDADLARDFIKQAALLSGIGATGLFPESIRRALAIEPQPGTTFLDAEHIVILMQENRSFDHTFGTLRGVRGFNDPRAITLPDGNPVWAQPDKKGNRFLPFRLNIKDTKSTWMGSLPHSWTNQVDARNDGRFDRWLDVKHSEEKAFTGMPLTLGYYTRGHSLLLRDRGRVHRLRSEFLLLPHGHDAQSSAPLDRNHQGEAIRRFVRSRPERGR